MILAQIHILEAKFGDDPLSATESKLFKNFFC